MKVIRNQPGKKYGKSYGNHGILAIRLRFVLAVCFLPIAVFGVVKVDPTFVTLLGQKSFQHTGCLYGGMLFMPMIVLSRTVIFDDDVDAMCFLELSTCVFHSKIGFNTV